MEQLCGDGRGSADAEEWQSPKKEPGWQGSPSPTQGAQHPALVMVVLTRAAPQGSRAGFEDRLVAHRGGREGCGAFLAPCLGSCVQRGWTRTAGARLGEPYPAESHCQGMGEGALCPGLSLHVPGVQEQVQPWDRVGQPRPALPHTRAAGLLTSVSQAALPPSLAALRARSKGQDLGMGADGAAGRSQGLFINRPFPWEHFRVPVPQRRQEKGPIVLAPAGTGLGTRPHNGADAGSGCGVWPGLPRAQPGLLATLIQRLPTPRLPGGAGRRSSPALCSLSPGLSGSLLPRKGGEAGMGTQHHSLGLPAGISSSWLCLQGSPRTAQLVRII